MNVVRRTKTNSHIVLTYDSKLLSVRMMDVNVVGDTGRGLTVRSVMRLGMSPPLASLVSFSLSRADSMRRDQHRMAFSIILVSA